MKKHDFGAWFLLCALLFLFAPGVSAMQKRRSRCSHSQHRKKRCVPADRSP